MSSGLYTGLVIGKGKLDWATLRVRADRVEPKGGGSAELGEDLQKELAGGGHAPEEAWAALKKAIAGIHGDVSVGLSGASVLLKVLELPRVEPEEMAGMVQLQVDKFSPFPVDTMVVSHEVLKEDAQTAHVLVGAAKMDVATGAGNFIEKAGVVPARMEALPLAWWHALRASREADGDGRHVYLILQENTCEMIVAEHGIPLLFRSFENSSAQVADGFLDEISEGLGYTLMSLELETGHSGMAGLSIWHTEAVSAAAVQKLVSNFSCPVKSESLTKLPPPAESLARLLALNQGMNLLPVAIRDERRGLAFRRKLLLIALGLLGMWALVVAIFMGGFMLEKAMLNRRTREMKELKGPADEVREMRRRVNSIQRYTDKSHSVLECLRETSRLQTFGIELTQVSYRKGEAIVLSGEASEASQVYDFKNKLDTSTLFTKGNLKGPQKVRGKETFEIELTLPGGEE